MTRQRTKEEVFRVHDQAAYRYLRVSDGEFAARHTAIRDWLEREALDAVLIAGGTGTWDRNWTNTRWAVNHVGAQLTNYSYVLFPRSGDPTVLTFPIQAWLPARRAREIVDDVRATTDPARGAVERLRELGLDRGAVGIVETDLYTSIPVAHHNTFTTELPAAGWRIVTRSWWRSLRLVRSAEEIRHLELAARIGDVMSTALEASLRAGLAEQEVFAVLSESMIRAGGETPSMVLAASGSMYTPADTFQRERHLSRVLQVGDVVLTELAPRFPDGSECQIGRSYALGAPSRRYLDLVAVVTETYDAIVATLRPGCTDGDVRRAAGAIADAGYTWLSPVVHGPEGGATGCLPHIASSVEQAEDQQILFAPDMVMTVQIHVGSDEFDAGIFVADTWVVTDDEPRRLHSYRRDPLVVLDP